MNETIKALEIVEAEFGFQADRLSKRSDANGSENENDHLADLRQGYEGGARYARILRNYHEGRIGQRRPDAIVSESIDAQGRSIAFTGDGE